MPESGPYLAKFKHKQEGLSATADEYLPPTTGFNSLLDDICKSLLIGYLPENQDQTVTLTAYPGTPQIRFPLTPWVGRYLVVHAMMERTAGAGTFRLKAEIEAPVSTKVTAFILTNSGALSAEQNTYDLSSVSGVDVRGMDGWLNIYMEVSAAATTGVLRGLSAWQGENISSNSYKMIP
jgi:hypothetical protein